MSTENEISAGDRQEVDLPALVEAVTYQVLKNVAQALISEGAMQGREPASDAERPDAPAQMSFYEAVRRFEIGLIRPDAPTQMSFYDEVRQFEIGLITRALQRANGKQKEAARLLGLKATTLNAKMKQYQMRGNERASAPPQPPSDGGGSRSASA